MTMEADDMETVHVDPAQTHRVSLAPKDRWGIAIAVAAIVVGVFGSFWGFSINVTNTATRLEGNIATTAKELKGDVSNIETKVDAVKSEVAELRTDVREIRTEARRRGT